MGFNKKTWDKDYTGSKGLRQLSREDAALKGYSSKKTVKKTKEKESK